MYCPKCGKEIPESARYCPNCGFDVRLLNKKDNEKTKSYNIFSVIGFVFSFFPIFNLFGIILLFVGLHQISKDKIEKGKALTIIGIIISFLNIAVAGLLCYYFLNEA